MTTVGAKAAVEELIVAINERDLARAQAVLADTVRVVTAGGRELGADGLRELVRETYGAFADLHVSVNRWIEDGDLVVSEEVMEGTHTGVFAGIPATGRPVRLPMVHVHRVVDGKIVERVAYHDTAGILRQISA